MINIIERALHIGSPAATSERQDTDVDLKQRVEIVVAKVDSLEARVEMIEQMAKDHTHGGDSATSAND